MMKLDRFLYWLNYADNSNTIYMLGCFGHPVTEDIIAQKSAQYPTWYTASRQLKFRNLIGNNYFGFDCVNMIKGILWGWSADEEAIYGGASYGANGVPDVNANGFFAKCTGKSTNFKNIVVGAAVWIDGHIGIYRGDNKVIETTYRWDDGVQITGVQNLGDYSTQSRKWSQWGLIPYIDYDNVVPDPIIPPEPDPEPETDKPIADDIFHPDIFVLPKEYYKQNGFQPLGATSLYRCSTDDLINGFPPKKDNNGFPIADGAICEVAQIASEEFCDIYRMAFGEWWKYGNDNKEVFWTDYPKSIYSLEEYPVQIIVINFYDGNTKLLALKDELYLTETFDDGKQSLSGVFTDNLTGRISQFGNGTWLYDHDYNAPTYTVTSIIASTKNVWYDKTRSSVLFYHGGF